MFDRNKRYMLAHIKEFGSPMYSKARHVMLKAIDHEIKSLIPKFNDAVKAAIIQIKEDLRIMLDNHCVAGERLSDRRKIQMPRKMMVQDMIMKNMVDLTLAWCEPDSMVGKKTPVRPDYIDIGAEFDAVENDGKIDDDYSLESDEEDI